MFFCGFVCRDTRPTVLAQLPPHVLQRISITPINVMGVFLSLPVVLVGERGRRERGGMQILRVNVYCVASTPGGGGYYKSPPFKVQYSCPHVFQCSEVFLIISRRYVFASSK